MALPPFNSKLDLHVIHAKYLTNRIGLFQMLIERMSAEGLLGSVNIVADKDPVDIRAEDFAPNFSTAHLAGDDKLSYFNHVIKPLAMTQVSNALKHKVALEAVASHTDPAQLHLIVEDDVLFNDGMVAGLRGAMALEAEAVQATGATTTPPVLVFLGVPSAATPTPLLRKVMDTFKFLPCCDSFLVNNLAARAILQHMLPIRFPMHLQLTFALLRLEGVVEMKMVAPNVFIDGTKLGALNTNLELNNRLVFNPVYNRMSQLVNALPNATPDAPVQQDAQLCREIDGLFQSFDYKNNPEYFYLKAKYETKKGNYDFARALYKGAFSMYEALGAPLTQGCDFMKDFMKLYREFQDEADA